MTNATTDRSFIALGDPTRRQILEMVARRPSAVGEIAARLPVSRPAVSQHLRVLKDAGLVRTQADGRRHVYYADPQGLVALRAHLERLWTSALDSFKAAAEDAGTQEGRKK